MDNFLYIVSYHGNESETLTIPYAEIGCKYYILICSLNASRFSNLKKKYHLIQLAYVLNILMESIRICFLQESNYRKRNYFTYKVSSQNSCFYSFHVITYSNYTYPIDIFKWKWAADKNNIFFLLSAYRSIITIYSAFLIITDS